MKVAFLIPVLNEIDLQRTTKHINEACEVDHDIIFAINGKMNSFFTQVRTTFLSDASVKAFMSDRPVNEHKLITLGMEMTEDYDATIIYSGKEEPNKDVIRAFISSWQAGNKIVYLRKEYSGIKKLGVKLKRAFYRMGIKALHIFKDRCAETDIQLLDQDVVKTINQLPHKNRRLRVLDSFVGYQTDVIQLEIDSKMKENKSYDEITTKVKTYGIMSIVSCLLALAAIIVGVLGIILSWPMSIVVYIILFTLGIFGIIMSFVLSTLRTLNFRVGQIVDVSELKDLRNKIEKYNITNKN